MRTEGDSEGGALGGADGGAHTITLASIIQSFVSFCYE
jgi:hypothetical protein